MIHKSHELYKDSDFTSEEYDRRNTLAIMVIDGGLSICKKCGEAEAGLVNSCQYNQQAAKWARLEYLEKSEE